MTLTELKDMLTVYPEWGDSDGLPTRPSVEIQDEFWTADEVRELAYYLLEQADEADLMERTGDGRVSPESDYIRFRYDIEPTD